jgi:hypothetical protein
LAVNDAPDVAAAAADDEPQKVLVARVGDHPARRRLGVDDVALADLSRAVREREDPAAAVPEVQLILRIAAIEHSVTPICWSSSTPARCLGALAVLGLVGRPAPSRGRPVSADES